MSQPHTADPVVDEDSAHAQEALESDEGVGVGTTDEPATFEPEEPSD
ncbi:MAG TPA: hypothetical protein VIC62_01250 [Nakamurella sp.]|jgi:hypothetical protein